MLVFYIPEVNFVLLYIIIWGTGGLVLYFHKVMDWETDFKKQSATSCSEKSFRPDALTCVAQETSRGLTCWSVLSETRGGWEREEKTNTCKFTEAQHHNRKGQQ